MSRDITFHLSPHVLNRIELAMVRWKTKYSHVITSCHFIYDILVIYTQFATSVSSVVVQSLLQCFFVLRQSRMSFFHEFTGNFSVFTEWYGASSSTITLPGSRFCSNFPNHSWKASPVISSWYSFVQWGSKPHKPLFAKPCSFPM